MPKAREVPRALVEVADTFVADYDVVDFLHGLAERCVSILDVDEAGVMLTDTTRTLHYVASSSERMRLVELLELQHEQWPCLDARLLRNHARTHNGQLTDTARQIVNGSLSADALGSTHPRPR